MSCEEHETLAADRDQVHEVVVAMGFAAVRIRKARRTALVGDLALCADEVDGAGVFAEVERLGGDDVPGAMVQAGLAAFAVSPGVEAEPIGQTCGTLVRAAVAPV